MSIYSHYQLYTNNLYSCRVTCGKDSVLFHIVQLEVGEGVLIQSQPSTMATSPAASPVTTSPSQPLPPFHVQVLHSFRSTCAHIHHVLHAAVRGKVGIQKNSKASWIKFSHFFSHIFFVKAEYCMYWIFFSNKWTPFVFLMLYINYFIQWLMVKTVISIMALC